MQVSNLLIARFSLILLICIPTSIFWTVAWWHIEHGAWLFGLWNDGLLTFNFQKQLPNLLDLFEYMLKPLERSSWQEQKPVSTRLLDPVSNICIYISQSLHSGITSTTVSMQTCKDYFCIVQIHFSIPCSAATWASNRQRRLRTRRRRRSHHRHPMILHQQHCQTIRRKG